MAQLDALRLSKALKERLVDFTLDNQFVKDPELRKIFEYIWSGLPENGGLISDLWVEAAFPSKPSTETLATLVEQKLFNGQLCQYLDKVNAVPKDRILYKHQYESIVAAQQGDKNSRPAIVVTAGTGAGKTESFLLPILNDLYNQKNNIGEGVKCIILYPMNALVNDQVDRLFSWLKDQAEVTLFHFTSETPEDSKMAIRNNFPLYKDSTGQPSKSRMRTRQQARGLETFEGKKIDLEVSQRGPVPDILVTNYSMLEYMLCRPQDRVFFGNNLRTIILDEAHLYTGTLAAEITLLLRRLYLKCGLDSRKIMHIATSATISGSQDELKDFASTLFSKDTNLVSLIEGEPIRLSFPEPSIPTNPTKASDLVEQFLSISTLEVNQEGISSFRISEEDCKQLSNILKLLVNSEIIENNVDKSSYIPAVFLRITLERSPLIHKLENIFWDKKRISLQELVKCLWDTIDQTTIQATINLLQLGAAARNLPSDYPLIPHRIHLLTRGNKGFCICLNKDCLGAEKLKINNLGTVLSGYFDYCVYCGSNTLSLCRCNNCGEWLLAGVDENNKLKPIPPFTSSTESNSSTTRYFSVKELPERTFIRIGKDGAINSIEETGIKVCTVEKICHCCEASLSENAKEFISNAPLTISIVAETILSELPELPSQDNLWLPAKGRRLLAFSDSRTEAARLGPRLTRQHGLQLVRSALVQCLNEALVDEESINACLEDIENYKETLKRKDLSQALRDRTQRKLEEAEIEYKNAISGGSIEDWAKKLSTISTVKELLDLDFAENHYSENWSQKSWELNYDKIKENLQLLIGYELARASNRSGVSIESLGLAEISYPGLENLTPPPALLGQIPSTVAREKLLSNWSLFLIGLCDSLRGEGVVTLSPTGSFDQDKRYPYGGFLIGRWVAENAEGTFLERFVGVTQNQRRRKFTEELLVASGLNREEAEELSPIILSQVFNQLYTNAVGDETKGLLYWLKSDKKQSANGAVPAIQIVFPKLALRRPMKLFKCPVTGHIWSRSILGCAPEYGCNNLQPITEEEVNNDPRVGRQRREIQSSKVFSIGLWAEEHSAQLSPKENRRIQDLFKSGIRNILSSTTTLELGIDIGGLNAVFMTNVPPGKANYLQRAGRAGRRADGSSIVVTFSRPQPFDREVFLRFGDYLDRTLKRPKVMLQRERIARRHAHAFLLGEFFRDLLPTSNHVGAMNAFGQMGDFCGVALPPRWAEGPAPQIPKVTSIINDSEYPKCDWFIPHQQKGLEKYFLDYLYWAKEFGQYKIEEYLKPLFLNSGLEGLLNRWEELFENIIDEFTNAIIRWREEYDPLFNAWIDCQKSKAKSQANAIRYQLATLYETTVIESLADKQFLPRYGFPISVHSLKVIAPDETNPTKIREEDQYRLARSGLLALREYVPGSQLLVGGKLITSHGLLKHWTGANLDKSLGLRGSYAYCEKTHFYYTISKELGNCPICEASPRKKGENKLLLPKHGFSSAAWDPPKLSTEVEKVGRTQKATITFSKINDKDNISIKRFENFAKITNLKAFYQEGGEILVYNAGENDTGFCICLNCGYADSELEKSNTDKYPKGFETHLPLTSVNRFGEGCWKNKDFSPLRKQILAARETTDILLIDFTQCIGSSSTKEEIILTIAYALQIAGARLLELDSREIGVLSVPTGELGTSFGAVLYDNVPGGAGHVLELTSFGLEWLEEAKKTLYVNEQHHKKCETACLDCLLTFDAQIALSKGNLKSRLAFDVITKLLNMAQSPSSLPNSIISSASLQVESPLINLSDDERQKKAKKRK